MDHPYQANTPKREQRFMAGALCVALDLLVREAISELLSALSC